MGTLFRKGRTKKKQIDDYHEVLCEELRKAHQFMDEKKIREIHRELKAYGDGVPFILRHLTIIRLILCAIMGIISGFLATKITLLLFLE